MTRKAQLDSELEVLKKALKTCMRLVTELERNPEYIRRGYSIDGSTRVLAETYATIDSYRSKAEVLRWMRYAADCVPPGNKPLVEAVDKVLREATGRGLASFRPDTARLVRRVVKSGVISTEVEYDVIRDYVSDEDSGTALWNAAATLLADYECKVSVDRSRSVQSNTLEQADANGTADGQRPQAREPKDD